MKCLDLVINLPTSKLNNTYTYFVPEQYVNEQLFGKRVLVDFSGRKVDGYVVSEYDINDSAEFKPILKILDVDAVFDKSLLDLAKWMAEFYLCPLSVALNLMVPRILSRLKGTVYLPGINETEYYELAERETINLALMNRLWQEGELSRREALRYATQEELKAWTEEGYLVQTGIYRAGYEFNKESGYVLGDFCVDTDLEPLRRKAPRQAVIIEMLLSCARIEPRKNPGVFPAASIKSLLSKKYIKSDTVADEVKFSSLQLNDEQILAAARIEDALHTGKKTDFLLFGVTSSGKTEVYLQAAQAAIKLGRGVLVLVPEIALTRQLVDVFSTRIRNIAVLHSAMTAGERYDAWRRIKNGEAKLVLGARSAVFAPLANIGLIVIDEEQEGSFKQEEMPRYHTREIARQRAKQQGAVILLGSATPSVETFHSAYNGVIQMLPLNQRIGGGPLPNVFVEDMKKAFINSPRGYISPFLKDKIAENLNRQEQIILFINRRGYSPMTVCWECGNISSCPSCAVGMTFHRDIGENVCHYCNLHLPQDSRCINCGSSHLQLMGAGTQRVEEEVRDLFPSAIIARLDVDSSRRKGSQKSIMDGMKSGQIDILVGTQMVAKGLDFPNVSLVGIVDADVMLNLPDFRAGERCFQLLVQAAGRAGRSKTQGEVVIQTFNPDHPIITMAARQDYLSFYNYEKDIRQVLDYPPFTRLLRIVLTGEIEDMVQTMADELVKGIEEIVDAVEDDISIIGPAACPIGKIKNKFRYQLMVKCTSIQLLRSIAARIMARETFRNVRIDIDFDPINTM